jgi:two-component system sensor histidine kinase KdpD
VFVSTRAGLAASLTTAVLSVLSFDYFFVPPKFDFVVTNPRDMGTLLIMLAVFALAGALVERIRTEREAARDGERQASVLYALSRTLAEAREPDQLASATARTLSTAVDAAITVTLGGEARPRMLPGDVSLPLPGTRGNVGALHVRPRRELRRTTLSDKDRRLLDAAAPLVGGVIERARLAEEAESARVRFEAEGQRSALLGSISHDLRTPLAAIHGAATTILQDSPNLSASGRTDLVRSIADESARLGRLVSNLLELTRLEFRAPAPMTESHAIEEVIGGALVRAEQQLGTAIRATVPHDLPLVPLDALLIEQVLGNLLENAVRHGAAPVELAARLEGASVVVAVSDCGPGLPSGAEDRVFEKFYGAGRPGKGTGLGLAICKSIVSAHGGRIWAESRDGGGARFCFSLPLAQSARSL